jgi:LCP family protein required for cell wall assembly
VRTTLKRGIGRGAAGGANGRSILPPDALSPARRYRQPDPPKRSGWRLVGRVLFWAVVVLVVLALALVGGIYLWLHEEVSNVQARTPNVIKAQKVLNVPLPNQATVALVIGYDKRAGDGSPGGRSDTLMLIRADPDTKTISMLSLPRDLLTEVHCPGRAPFRGKINSAYSICNNGVQGALQTVKALTRIPINYLITVNFRGFKKVVNTLDGVWVDVDRRYFNNQGGPGGYAKINLMPGYQQLTGGSALDYVRYRHTDSDLVRVARQQQFVEAMKAQFSKEFSPLKVPKLVGAITHNMEVGQGGGGDISLGKVVSYARFAYELPSGHFFQTRIGGLTLSGSDLVAGPSSIQKAINNFLSPDVEAPKAATNVALGRKPKATAPKPAQTSIQVLNGNGVDGAAANGRYALGLRGYRMLEPRAGRTADAPSFDYFHTKIYYRPGDARARAAARSVARLFITADVEWIPPRIRRLSNGAMLTVVLGQTFHNSLAAAQPKPEIKRQPPNIRFDPAATKSLVRSKQKLVPFPLMVPTVLERGSTPDQEMPIRAYRIHGPDKAVRMVFRAGTGQSLYWGIEQTAWKDAPVLDDKNFRHVLRGRTYDLYYDGSHLHMIVLRANGATYWVVNTLLDDLSNETMIAIARGLKPLGKA